MTDKEFENYLREFEPRKLRALPMELIDRNLARYFDGWKRLVAAAAIVLVCGLSLWMGLRERSPVQTAQKGFSEKFEMEKSVDARKRTVFELTKAALEDSDAFEATMSHESQRILPRFDGRGGALRVLAKE